VKTRVVGMLGIEFPVEFPVVFPVVAFSHCRDVVAAVSKACGMGVLGAAAHSSERLDIDLDWIESKVGDRPYGVDVIIPARQADLFRRADRGHDERDEDQRPSCARAHRGVHRLGGVFGSVASHSTGPHDVHRGVHRLGGVFGSAAPDVIASGRVALR